MSEQRTTAQPAGPIGLPGVDNRVLTFVAPVEITFGAGTIDQLGGKVRATGGKKAFVVTDRGLVAAGIAGQVVERVQAAGLETTVFDEVEENPKETTVERGAKRARECGADCVIAVGGGSSMDAAKVIAALADHPGKRPRDLEGRDRIEGDPLPMVFVPTTAGTASEVTFNAVITDDRPFKMVIVSPRIVPRAAILDPELTISKPPGLTAATGMDALTHAIESFTNRVWNPIADALSGRAIQLIGRSLRTAVYQGRDPEARSDMLLGSLLAGMAFNMTRLGIVHAMSHPVGAHFNVPHGIANSILLPRVMEFNLFGCIDKTAQVAELLGENTAGLGPVEAARKGVEAVWKLSRDVGIPGSLRDVGVDPAKIPVLAEDSMKSGNIPVNPRLVTRADIARIFELAMSQH